MLNVWPVVYVDFQGANTPVACSVDALETEPVAVDDLTVKWGRSGYYDRVAAAELSLTMWDGSGEWARRIRDNRALGTNIQVMWESEDTRTGKRNRGTLYKGLTTGVNAKRMERTNDDGEHFWEISLTAHDPLSSLGNIYPLPGKFGAGRFHERATWIQGLLQYGGIVINGIVYQSAYANAAVAPLEVGKDSAAELLNGFFDSMSGDSYTYAPDYNAIFQTERHDGDFNTFLASFSDEIGAVMVSSADSTVNNRVRPGIAISGCTIDVGDAMEITATPDTDINRVETTYNVWSDADKEWQDTVTSTESIPTGQPRRIFSNDCWFFEPAPAGDNGRGLIRLQHRSLWERARAEGRRPKHPDMTFHAGKEFPTERVLKWWLTTYEDARPGFINGDESHRWMMSGERDWSPIVSPLGGTVTYNGDDGWTIDVNVQWSHNRTTITPMVWGNLQQIQWRAGEDSYPWWWDIIGLPHPDPKPVGMPTPERDVYWGAPADDSEQYRMDKSVKWSDLKYLDNGAREIKDLLE